jgi:predicted CoA-binding protein
MHKIENVAILGASNKPDRYSFLAQELLTQAGHQVYPVNPKDSEVAGVKCYKNLSEIKEAIDTVTIYINPSRLTDYLEELINLKPKRVIFNPGTESAEVEAELKRHDIAVIHACTLVLLKTGQY